MADVQHVHYVIFDREKDAVNVRLLAYKSWRTSKGKREFFGARGHRSENELSDEIAFSES